MIRYRHPQGRERVPLAGEDRDGVPGTVDVLGLDPDPGSAAIGHIHGAALTRARWWITPLPRVRWSASIGDLDLDLTRGVLLTATELPDPFTGLRGMTARPAVVVRRSISLERATVELELILLPAPRVCLWAPSGTIDSVAGVQLTLEANDYTPGTDATWDQVPERDALAFTVGDQVQLCSTRGVRLTDVVRTVTAVEPGGVLNRIDIDAAWTLGGAPVVPAAGDVVRFVQWSGGAAPQAAWTATMQYHAAQASAAGVLPDASAAYVYGGV